MICAGVWQTISRPAGTTAKIFATFFLAFVNIISGRSPGSEPNSILLVLVIEQNMCDTDFPPAVFYSTTGGGGKSIGYCRGHGPILFSVWTQCVLGVHEQKTHVPLLVGQLTQWIVSELSQHKIVAFALRLED